MMNKSLWGIIFGVFLHGSPLVAQSNFERSKLEILCQSIRFNHLMQGKAEVTNRLDCSSLQSLEKSIPISSRSSRNIVTAFKNKTYPSIAIEPDKTKQLKKEVLNELRRLGAVISKSESFQKQWKSGLDSLSSSLDKSLSINSEELSEGMEGSKNSNLDQTIIPIEPKRDTTPTEPNTGLWIISILSILIAFVSLGYAYLTQKTTAHKLKEIEILLKERYQHLDVRMDKMLTKEEYQKPNTSV